MLKSLYDVFSPLIRMKTLELLANPQLPSYNPALLAVVAVELLANVGFIIFTLVIIPKFFKKQASAPNLMVIWYATSVVINALDIVLTAFTITKDGIDPKLSIETVRAVVIAAIWIPYFMHSVRVKNTFGQNAFSKPTPQKSVHPHKRNFHWLPKAI